MLSARQWAPLATGVEYSDEAIGSRVNATCSTRYSKENDVNSRRESCVALSELQEGKRRGISAWRGSARWPVPCIADSPHRYSRRGDAHHGSGREFRFGRLGLRISIGIEIVEITSDVVRHVRSLRDLQFLGEWRLGERIDFDIGEFNGTADPRFAIGQEFSRDFFWIEDSWLNFLEAFDDFITIVRVRVALIFCSSLDSCANQFTDGSSHITVLIVKWSESS